jgi:hypothetical protein
LDGYYSLVYVVFQDPCAASKRNNYISRFIEKQQSKVEPALGRLNVKVSTVWEYCSYCMKNMYSVQHDPKESYLPLW